MQIHSHHTHPLGSTPLGFKVHMSNFKKFNTQIGGVTEVIGVCYMLWGPKWRFLGKPEATWVHGLIFLTPKIVLLEQIFITSYDACKKEIICQSCVARKLMYQFTQTRPIVLVLHLLGLGFWMFMVFHCFPIIYKPSSFILKQILEVFSHHISS